MRNIVFTGGGTLGSVSPLIAIAEKLTGLRPVFIGTKSGVERHFVIERGIPYHWIFSARLRRYPSLKTIFDAVKLPFACLQALFHLQKIKPVAVVSAGGFVAVPVAFAAWLLQIPIFIHQQDAVVTLSNRLVAPLASTITVSFSEQKRMFPKRTVNVVGNPARSLGHQSQPEKKQIVILGGSSGARGMNEVMRTLIPRWTRHFEVVHMLGQGNLDQALPSMPNYRPYAFLGKSYGPTLAEASIVISRAGMSAITELASLSKAVIVIPMPRTHQEKNADFFLKSGSVLVASQNNTDEIDGAVTKLMDDPGKRLELGRALHTLFPADAAETYARLIMSSLGLKHEKRAFFVGIGGIGVSALARLFQHEGYTVEGSDVQETPVTTQLSALGITVYPTHDKAHITEDLALVVHSDAVPSTNEELEAAHRLHIPTKTLHDVLGDLSRRMPTIAVCGTHGKTTTTAWLGHVMSDSSLDPTVFVGSLVPQFGMSNIRLGSKNLFIAEADEYRGHLLKLHPRDIIITNIERDHLDYFKDFRDIKRHFQLFCESMPDEGRAVVNADDAAVRSLNIPHAITYGMSPRAQYRIKSIDRADGGYDMMLMRGAERLGNFIVPLSGRFNCMNAAAVIAMSAEWGIDLDHIRERIASFSGTWRRQERIGTNQGRTIISDYAHHPTEISSTLAGLRETNPDARLITIFQPHSVDRTKKLFTSFQDSFRDADTVLCTDIYDVFGRDSDQDIQSRDFVESLSHPDARYTPAFDDVLRELNSGATPADLLIFMGAGSIDQLARSYANEP